MTIASSTSKITANGNDAGTVFSFSPMVIFASTDLVVTLVNAEGDETLLAEGASSSTYSVSVAEYPGTGSITYPASGGTPLATGSKLVITRSVPAIQSLDLEAQGGYFPDNVEAGLDRLTILAQQLKEKLDRAIVVTVGSDSTPEELLEELQSAAETASVSAAAAEAAALVAEAAALTAQNGTSAIGAAIGMGLSAAEESKISKAEAANSASEAAASAASASGLYSDLAAVEAAANAGRIGIAVAANLQADSQTAQAAASTATAAAAEATAAASATAGKVMAIALSVRTETEIARDAAAASAAAAAGSAVDADASADDAAADAAVITALVSTATTAASNSLANAVSASENAQLAVVNASVAQTAALSAAVSAAAAAGLDLNSIWALT